MKATEQHFSVVLFIKLYKVVLNFESVDGILNCDHSNESYGAELFWCCMLCSFNHSRLCKNPKKYNVTNYRF